MVLDPPSSFELSSPKRYTVPRKSWSSAAHRCQSCLQTSWIKRFVVFNLLPAYISKLTGRTSSVIISYIPSSCISVTGAGLYCRRSSSISSISCACLLLSAANRSRPNTCITVCDKSSCVLLLATFISCPFHNDNVWIAIALSKIYVCRHKNYPLYNSANKSKLFCILHAKFA